MRLYKVVENKQNEYHNEYWHLFERLHTNLIKTSIMVDETDKLLLKGIQSHEVDFYW